jgi:hypothetical protein
MILAASLGGASPTVVHRGQLVQVGATVGTSNGCFAHVDFADATGVDLGTKYPDGQRHVAWSYRVPLKAPLGPAQWSIRCGTGIYNYSGNWLIVPAGVTVGPKPPPPVVSKQGFSQRADAFGTGSSVSYGLLIRNPALKKDAKSVTVTISFVAGTGNVIGRKTARVARIGAGETYALGGATELGTQTDVKKLTASIRVGSYARTVTMPRPRVTSARIVGNTADPGWVGEVDGELANDTSQHTLARTFVSIVVLNAGGRIVGGGTGTLTSPVASGATGPFTAKVGFAAIATSDAARPVVSVVPTYR